MAEKERDMLTHCVRKLGDATYEIALVVGILDEAGIKTGRRNLLAAHGQITKARAALRASSPQEENEG